MFERFFNSKLIKIYLGINLAFFLLVALSFLFDCSLGWEKFSGGCNVPSPFEEVLMFFMFLGSIPLMILIFGFSGGGLLLIVPIILLVINVLVLCIALFKTRIVVKSKQALDIIAAVLIGLGFVGSVMKISNDYHNSYYWDMVRNGREPSFILYVLSQDYIFLLAIVLAVYMIIVYIITRVVIKPESAIR